MTGDKVPYGVGRQAVVRAAIDIVAEEGLSRITYRSLAAKAGVTHGVVQHHFSSIEAVLEEALQLCLEISLKPLHAVGTPGEFIDSTLEVVEADPAVHVFQYELILEAKRTPSYRPHVERLYASYWDTMTRALEAMQLDSSEEMVRAVFAALDGMVFQMVTVAAADPRAARATTEGLRRLLDNAHRSAAVSDR